MERTLPFYCEFHIAGRNQPSAYDEYLPLKEEFSLDKAHNPPSLRQIEITIRYFLSLGKSIVHITPSIP
jgi:hypothetical protein